jgi:SOS-response transcriptional repressor LexA
MNKNQQKIIALAKKKDISGMGFRKIGRELGIINPQTVIYHLEQLKKKGLLYFDTKKRQRVAKPKAFVVDKLFNIPVVGFANCGQATELAQEDIRGYLRISRKSIGKSTPDGLIIIQAVGDSLNLAKIEGDNIENNDYVVVDCKRHPINGDYVLSVIGGAANFKRFYRDDQKKEIHLISESTQDIAPIIIHEEDLESSNYLINGVVVRVIKKPKS